MNTKNHKAWMASFCMALTILFSFSMTAFAAGTQSSPIQINISNVSEGNYSGYKVTVEASRENGAELYRYSAVTITENGYYTITGKNTNSTNGFFDGNTLIVNRLVVANGLSNVNITFNSTTIDMCASIANQQYKPAFEINVNSIVNLTLAGANSLTAYAENAALRVMSAATLTIGGTGSLTAEAHQNGAGIGGSQNGTHGDIIINDGNILASSMGGGAGIGGGYGGAGGNITINGGNVTVAKISEGVVTNFGSGEGAGIGGGDYANGGIVIINGGTVIANGGQRGAGIGGGNASSGGTVNITGGTVYANGGYYTSVEMIGGAGIGGGTGGGLGVVNISGGTVYAYGGLSAAGIGGNSSNVGTVNISGGNVTAAGSAPNIVGGNIGGGAGIGGSLNSAGANISISGGIVVASGGSSGPAIGRGTNNLGTSIGSLTITGGSLRLNDGNILGTYTPTPTNGQGRDVHLITLTVGSPAITSQNITAGNINGVNCATTANTAQGVYGIKNVRTDNAGNLYFWLPAGDYPTMSMTASSIAYSNIDIALTANNNNTATLYNLSGHVSVTDITDVPTILPVGQYNLNGTVAPTDATNKTITWSVVTTGTTGATLSGNRLTTTAAGMVTLRATVALGLGNADYVKNINILIGQYDLTVTGGQLLVDYTYAGNVVTILTETPMTISGTTVNDRVEIKSGVTANLTIHNLNITNNTRSFDAFSLNGTAKLFLTLSGDNRLKSGLDKAGLSVPGGTELTINAASTGSLTAEGGESGAGIGRGLGALATYCGTITIHGGTVNAIAGYNAAGIGGSLDGGGGTVTITGGTIVATGSGNGGGIGAGADVWNKGHTIGILTITGGSVKRSGIADREATATNGLGTNVYLVTMTIGVPAVPNTPISAGIINGVNCDETPNAANRVYGIKGVTTDSEGKLYFWLPQSVAGIVNMTAGEEYLGAITPKTDNSENVTLTNGFVPVTNITSVPNQMSTEFPLTLQGTVEPLGATFKNIVWSVSNDGGTNASLTGNVLTADDAGTVTVTATISQSTLGTAFIQNFNIEVFTQDLIVDGGIKNTDYTYTNGVLSILTGTPMIISGVTTNDRISVDVPGGMANLTINNLNCDLSATSTGYSAFYINNTVKLNLTITGNNTIKSQSTKAGINVCVGAELIITANSTGSLTAAGGPSGAGIGSSTQSICGTIIINGGTIYSTGGSSSAGIGGGYESAGGSVTINGGTVHATGGQNAPGIGGGFYGEGVAVVITGGTVNATGGDAGAGIGGGSQGTGSTVVITGGTVNATGGFTYIGSGAGIGGSIGSQSNGTLTITGGSVKRNGDTALEAAATNGQANVYLTTMTTGIPCVADALVTAGSINGVACSETPNPATGVYGIRDVYTDNMGKLYFWLPQSAAGDVGIETAGQEYEGAIAPQTDNSEYVILLRSGNSFVAATGITGVPDEMSRDYPLTLKGTAEPYNATFGEIVWSLKHAGVTGATLTNGVLTAQKEGVITVTATISQSPFAAAYSKDFVIAVFAEYSGQDLIIKGGWRGTDYDYSGSKLYIMTNKPMTISGVTTREYISVEAVAANLTINHLYIDMNELNNSNSAFIVRNSSKLNLTINGDNIIKGGNGYAGFQLPAGAELTITANSTGNLTAVGGNYSAGIGSHINNGDGGTLTINGGTINATGGDYAAGIGGGRNGSGGTVTITGGMVVATGGANAAGIGGGFRFDSGGSGGTVVITGGTVVATGGENSAGIGKGYGGSSNGTLTITGGSVKRSGNTTYEATATNDIDPVYFTILTVGDPFVANAKITAGKINDVTCDETPDAANGVYGINDVITDSEGKLYFWLPAGTDVPVSIITDNKNYIGIVNPGTSTAAVTLLEFAPPAITTTTLPGGTVGTAYSQTLTATGGQPITWSIESGSLPTGLSLDESTGLISGTPSAVGTFTFEVKAENNEDEDIKELSLIIGKTSQTAPSAPTEDSKTATSVTLEAVTGAEYSMDGLSWQDEPEFTSLAPNTQYTFYVRYKETATHNASSASEPLTVTTDKAMLGRDTGAITGVLKYGEVLTADASGISSLPDISGTTGFGALSYQWYHLIGSSHVIIPGATNSTYTITQDDIGKSILVIISAANCQGGAGSYPSETIAKADGAAAAAPGMESKTVNSIKLIAVSVSTGQTVEYACSTTNSVPTVGWQESVTFINLNEGTDYYFFARAKESSTHTLGAASAGSMIRTDGVIIPTYGVSIATFSNGTVTADKADYEEGETVTLTLSDISTGYELDVISVYKTGDVSTAVETLRVTSLQYTFIMPAYGVTVTATFKNTQEQLDKEAIASAKEAVEGGTFSIAQKTGNTQESVKTWLVNTLNVMFGQSHNTLFRSATGQIIGDVTIKVITPAVEGTETTPAGIDGSFKFTVTLTKGSSSLITGEIHGVIVATPYTDTPTGIEKPQVSSLIAYVHNGTLYVSGLTVGKPWSVYNISGALVYQGVATNTVETLHATSLHGMIRGVYIVKSDRQTAKVIY